MFKPFLITKLTSSSPISSLSCQVSSFLSEESRISIWSCSFQICPRLPHSLLSETMSRHHNVKQLTTYIFYFPFLMRIFYRFKHSTVMKLFPRNSNRRRHCCITCSICFQHVKILSNICNHCYDGDRSRFVLFCFVLFSASRFQRCNRLVKTWSTFLISLSKYCRCNACICTAR